MLNLALNIILAANFWNFTIFSNIYCLKLFNSIPLEKWKFRMRKSFVSRHRMNGSDRDPGLTGTEKECVLPLFHGTVALSILTLRYQMGKRTLA